MKLLLILLLQFATFPLLSQEGDLSNYYYKTRVEFSQLPLDSLLLISNTFLSFSLQGNTEINKVYPMLVELEYILYRKKQYELGEKLCSAVLQNQEFFSSQEEISHIHYLKGENLSKLGKYENAFQQYQLALSFSPSLKLQLKIFNAIASFYYKRKDYSTSLKYDLKSLSIHKQLATSTKSLIISYNNISTSYLELHIIDSAFFYAKKGLLLAEDSLKGMQIALLNTLGRCHLVNQNFKEAEIVFKQAHQIEKLFSRGRVTTGLSIILGDLGKANTGLMQYQTALQYYTSAIKIAIKTNAIYELQILEYNISELYASLNTYDKAYQHLMNYLELQDSIIHQENRKNIQELETKYQTTQKEQEITLLQEKEKTQKAELKQQQTLNYALIGGAILFAGLAINFFRSRQKQQETTAVIANYNLALEDKNKHLAELNQFKDALTGMIAHDLKNPLAYMLTESREPKVQQSALQMHQLISNLLDVQKMEEVGINLQTATHSLSALFQTAVEQVYFLAQQQFVRISPQFPSSTLQVAADQDLIVRVLVNLLSNAIKYSPKNGLIKVQAKQERETVIFSITDQGPGIASEQQAQVFEKFNQLAAKHSGSIRSTGLGLTFCKMAIEAHGGDIGINSTAGEGATFWFRLPIEQESVTTTPSTVSSQAYSPQLVQLSSVNQQLLATILQELQELKVYEFTKIEPVLAKIKHTDANVLEWKQAIEEAVWNCNEEVFECLVG